MPLSSPGHGYGKEKDDKKKVIKDYGSLDLTASSASSYFSHQPPPLRRPLLSSKMASILKALLTLLAFAFLTVRAADGNASSSPTVTVQNGSYTGLYNANYDQDLFLGLRYAQPASRFRLAEPLANASWSTPQPATSYPPSCVGFGSDDIGYELSEDCLFLNVIRPASTSPNDSLPVAVWIHGGGLVMGGSADRRYNLSFIVANSVELGTPMIAVSLNYRLSAFGFLHGEEALEAGIANNGFRDQRLALQWVHENIAAFGGDPDKVTIWGESSGAESVSAQVLAYNGRDDGLFRAAIGQSGFGGILSRYAGGFNATDKMQATYDLLVSNTSCTATATVSSLDCLRALPLDTLTAALNGTAAGPWAPMLDGDFIADYPVNQLRDGRYPQVALMIGANVDEGSAFGQGRGPADGPVNTDADMRFAVANIMGVNDTQKVDEALALYPNIQAVGIPSIDKFPVIVEGDELASTLGLQYRRTGALFGDFTMQYLRRRASIAWSDASLPSYAYMFDVTVNGMPNYIGATHFQEVAFVFDNTQGLGYDAQPNPFANTTDAFPQLAKAMSNAWVRFVVGLDPNGDGLGVEWPVYDAAEGGGVGKIVVFDVNGTYVDWDSFREEGNGWMRKNSLELFGV